MLVPLIRLVTDVMLVVREVCLGREVERRVWGGRALRVDMYVALHMTCGGFCTRHVIQVWFAELLMPCLF